MTTKSAEPETTDGGTSKNYNPIEALATVLVQGHTVLRTSFDVEATRFHDFSGSVMNTQPGLRRDIFALTKSQKLLKTVRTKVQPIAQIARLFVEVFNRHPRIIEFPLRVTTVTIALDGANIGG